MPSFSRTITALGTLRSAIDKVHETATQRAPQIRKALADLQDESRRRLSDFKSDLAQIAESGEGWASRLLELIQQVEAGSIRADQALGKFGAAQTVFEGQIRGIDELLVDLLPTTGEVRSEIAALIEQLQGADVSTIVDRLRDQANAYASILADLAENFERGQGSMERILMLVNQIRQRLGGSGTDALAGLLVDAIEDAQAAGTL